MRVSIVLLSVSLLPSVAICQSSAQENLEGLVRAFLNQKSKPLLIESPMEGPLNRSGDAAAVAVTRVVQDRDLSPEEIDRILLIINMSFAAPRIVEPESDRQPRTTLFLLKYLDTLPVSPELKHKIAATKQFVEQSAKSAVGRRAGS